MSQPQSQQLSQSEQITIHIVNMGGEVFNLVTRHDIRSYEFPFLVHEVLPEPRPPIAFLRFFHEGKEEEEFLPDSHDHRFQNNERFRIFVAEPEINVCFHKVDDATDYEVEGDFEFYQLCVSDMHNRILLDVQFYTHFKYRTVEHWDAEPEHIKHYTKKFYHELDVTVLYNPSPAARHNGDDDQRTICIHENAKRYLHPSSFALSSPFPMFHSFLVQKIDESWVNLVSTAHV